MELPMSFLYFLYSQVRLSSLETGIRILKRVIVIVTILLKIIFLPIISFSNTRKNPPCPPTENELLFFSAAEAARKIRRKQLTSEEIVSAYIARCKEVNPVLTAIIEERFEEALQDARMIDQFLKVTEKNEEELASDKPLLGIPISVKGSLAVKGFSHSAGLKLDAEKKATEDADVVRRVREAGGIPLLLSNVPELCMWFETYNKIVGMTMNPYDTNRTAGGSSGGEGALIGSGASILGLGSDIGGSLRLPAMFCGIFSHKPTPGWVSVVGHRPDNYLDKESWIARFTVGTIARYSEDLPLILKVMAQSEDVVRCLERKASLKDIKIFYMEENSGDILMEPVDEEIKCCIRKLVRYLEENHDSNVQKICMESMNSSVETSIGALLDLKGYETVWSKTGEFMGWMRLSVELMRFVFRDSPHILSNLLYALLKKLYELVAPQAYLARIRSTRSSMQKEFQELLGDNGVFICPSFVCAAPQPHEMFFKFFSTSYMILFNALELPVTQCPIGLNREGLPIGIQIVGNAGCDRLTITVAQEIEKAFGGWQKPWKSKERESL